MLAESDDIALMNDEKIRGASRDGYPAGVVAGADQLWYVDAYVPRLPEFRRLLPQP